MMRKDCLLETFKSVGIGFYKKLKRSGNEHIVRCNAPGFLQVGNKPKLRNRIF